MPENYCRRCLRTRPTYHDIISGQHAERCAACHYPVAYGEAVSGRKIDILTWNEDLKEEDKALRRRRQQGVVFVEWLILLAVLTLIAIAVVGRRL